MILSFHLNIFGVILVLIEIILTLRETNPDKSYNINIILLYKVDRINNH